MILNKIETYEKLKLKKQTIAALDNAQMANVKGGFTYSLSTGQGCKVSKSLTASNNYECGAMLAECPEWQYA